MKQYDVTKELWRVDSDPSVEGVDLSGREFKYKEDSL